MRRLFANLLLGLLSLGITLGALEGGLRTLNFLRGIPNQRSVVRHHRDFCEYDPLLGWRHKKNVHRIFSTREFKANLSFNSKGLRGPEIDYPRKAGHFRVLILGDSFAEGYTVNEEQLLSARLQNILETRGMPCEVINAGVAGYSTDQELLYYQTEGKRYQPDLTVLMFYDNDIWYNNQPQYGRGAKPLFQLKEGQLVLKNVPLARPDYGPRTIYDCPPRSLFEWFHRWLSEYSILYQELKERIIQSKRLSRLLVKMGWLLPKVIEDYNTVYAKQPSAAVSEAWKLTESILQQLQKETAENGSRLLVFYVPDTWAIYDREWEDTFQEYHLQPDQWSPKQVASALESLCRRNFIDYLNPTESFRIQAGVLDSEKKRLYNMDDFHWNAAGHDLAAHILADAIAVQYPSGNTSAASWSSSTLQKAS